MVLLLKVLKHCHVALLLLIVEDEIAWAPVSQALGTVAPAYCTIPADLDLHDQTWHVSLKTCTNLSMQAFPAEEWPSLN